MSFVQNSLNLSDPFAQKPTHHPIYSNIILTFGLILISDLYSFFRDYDLRLQDILRQNP